MRFIGQKAFKVLQERMKTKKKKFSLITDRRSSCKHHGKRKSYPTGRGGARISNQYRGLELRYSDCWGERCRNGTWIGERGIELHTRASSLFPRLLREISQTEDRSIWLQTTKYSICMEKQQSHVDTSSACNAITVEQGGRSCPCEATAMSVFSDTSFIQVWSV